MTVPAEDTQHECGQAFYSKETIAQRLWRRLGFRYARADRPEADEYAEDFAPSWFVCETLIHLDWRDRLRVLLTGNMMVQQAIKTDATINRSRATSAVGVLPFGAVERAAKRAAA